MKNKSTIKEEIKNIANHLINDNNKYQRFIEYNPNTLYNQDFYEYLNIKPTNVRKDFNGWTSLERYIYNIRYDYLGLARNNNNGFGSQPKFQKIKERILNEYNSIKNAGVK